MKQKNKASRFFASIIFFALSVLSWWLGNKGCFSQQVLSQEDKISKSQEYYLAGKRLIEEGNYAEADKAFKMAQYLLSEAAPFTSSEMPPEAAMAPAKQPVVNAAAAAYAASRKGLSEEAIPLYLKAIEACPEQVGLHYNLAVEYLKTNQFKKAAEFFKKVILLDPKDKNAYYNLGVLYESYLKDKRQALQYYTKYLKLASPKEDTREVKEWIRQINKELSSK